MTDDEKVVYQALDPVIWRSTGDVCNALNIDYFCLDGNRVVLEALESLKNRGFCQYNCAGF